MTTTKQAALEALKRLMVMAEVQPGEASDGEVEKYRREAEQLVATIRAALQPTAVELLVERYNQIKFLRDGYGRCSISVHGITEYRRVTGPTPEAAAQAAIDAMEQK